MEHHNKKYVYWLCVIVIAMFVLPCVVARLASECNGMTLCIILFLVLNPVLSYWGLFVKKHQTDVELISAVMFFFWNMAVFLNKGNLFPDIPHTLSCFGLEYDVRN